MTHQNYVSALKHNCNVMFYSAHLAMLLEMCATSLLFTLDAQQTWKHFTCKVRKITRIIEIFKGIFIVVFCAVFHIEKTLFCAQLNIL